MIRYTPIFVVATVASVVLSQACMSRHAAKPLLTKAGPVDVEEAEPVAEVDDLGVGESPEATLNHAFATLDRVSTMRVRAATVFEAEKPAKISPAVRAGVVAEKIAALPATSLAAKTPPPSKGSGVTSAPAAARVPQLADLPELKVLPSAPKIPRRPANALAGSAVLQAIASLGIVERERVLLRELRRGNIPNFLRRLVPIRLRSEQGEAVVAVMPDYLAVGSDQDFVRVPLSRYAAARIAREWGFVLPTTRIVDAVYAQADVQLKPMPLPASGAMVTVPYLMRHERMVQASMGLKGMGKLVAGSKKDLVLTAKLSRHPNRVAIYGWHQSDDRPIQPLSDVHDGYYSDYSHGVRLVSAVMSVDGRKRSIYDVLADDDLAWIISSEGRLADARRQMRQAPKAMRGTAH